VLIFKEVLCDIDFDWRGRSMGVRRRVRARRMMAVRLLALLVKLLLDVDAAVGAK